VAERVAEKEKRFAVVISVKDYEKLSYGDRAAIGNALDNIERRRISDKNPGFARNNYIVCNQDEPYAEAVWQLILLGEDWKNGEGVPPPKILMDILLSGDWSLLDDAVLPTVGAEGGKAEVPDFESMTKADIMAWVAADPDTFDLEAFILDMSMKKDEMIRMIKEHLEIPF